MLEFSEYYTFNTWFSRLVARLLGYKVELSCKRGKYLLLWNDGLCTSCDKVCYDTEDMPFKLL